MLPTLLLGCVTLILACLTLLLDAQGVGGALAQGVWGLGRRCPALLHSAGLSPASPRYLTVGSFLEPWPTSTPTGPVPRWPGHCPPRRLASIGLPIDAASCGCGRRKSDRGQGGQILDGIHFLHENQAVHRDIKGANVLVAHNGVLKIADFGATMMLSGQKTMTEDGKQIQGTPYWMAPEVIKQEAYGRKADIWSLGMTVLEMATAKHPWQTFSNKFAAMTEIASGVSSPAAV